MPAFESNELDTDQLRWLVTELSTRSLPAIGESCLVRLREQLEVCQEAEFDDEEPTLLLERTEPRERVVER